MRKIVIILTTTLLLFSTQSCKDWLDIRPEGETVLEDYWKDESQVTRILAASYKALTEANAMTRMMVWGELRSDNVGNTPGMPSDMFRMVNVDITTSNSYCSWGSIYTVINYCNSFLYYAPDVVELDPNFTISKYRAMEAEVLAIRALAYFYLTRTFKEVPLVLEPSINDEQNYNIPKANEEVILDQIVADLTTALANARDYHEKPTYTKGRFTKNGVRALLADVYLWREQYSQAIAMCDEIINDTQQNLELEEGERVLNAVFYQGNSSESIFELQFDEDNIFNGAVQYFYGGNGNIRGIWSFPFALMYTQASPFRYKAGGGTIESEEDLREIDFLRSEGDMNYVFKYAGTFRQENTDGSNSYYYRSNTANWIVYRLSDILLMKAEALIQLGTNNAEALRLINTTYLRSNPELQGDSLRIENYSSQFELNNLLLRERQRELMFEGKRWFDLMRLARREDSPAPLLSYVSKKFSGAGGGSQITKMSVMNALYLPIHINELNANTELEQNPFYEIESDGTSISE